VVELHAGVDVGDDDALTSDPESGPDLWGVDAINAPLDRVHRLFGLPGIGLGNLVGLLSHDPLDLVLSRYLLQHVVACSDLDRVDDPERLIAHATLGEQRAQPALALVGDPVE